MQRRKKVRGCRSTECIRLNKQFGQEVTRTDRGCRGAMRAKFKTTLSGPVGSASLALTAKRNIYLKPRTRSYSTSDAAKLSRWSTERKWELVGRPRDFAQAFA